MEKPVKGVRLHSLLKKQKKGESQYISDEFGVGLGGFRPGYSDSSCKN